MEELDYDQKLLLLNKILQDGIAKLLVEAKAKNYLDPPHGRLPIPTPLITEEQFIQNGGIHCDDSPPEFKFEYGFDPLKYIADFIIWSHPESIENRRLQKVNAAVYLQKRAEHARKQLFTAQSLSYLAEQQRSGILWGPFTSPLTNTSVLCICKPIKAIVGKVVIQISTNSSFTDIIKTIEQKVETSERDPIPVKVVINDLLPGNRYYIRCCLSSNSFIKELSNKPEEEQSIQPSVTEEEIEEELKLDFPGLPGNKFMYSEFQVLPSDISEPALSFPTVTTEDVKIGAGRKKSAMLSKQSSVKENAAQIALSYKPIVLNCFGQLALDHYLNGVGYNIIPTPATQSSSPPSESTVNDINTPELSILIGDVMKHVHDDDQHAALTGTGRMQSKEESAITYENDLIKLYTRCPLFYSTCNVTADISHTSAFLRHKSFILGWRDGSDGSNYALRAEELAYKQYIHELKRHQKKLAKSNSRQGSDKLKNTTLHHLPPAPTLKRLPLTDSITALIRELPIPSELFIDNHTNIAPSSSVKLSTGSSKETTTHTPPAENVKACMMMYRSLLMGPDVLLIILDIRGRGSMGEYLGKEQAQWLSSTLKDHADIQWKIIICGKSFGIVGIPPTHTNTNNPENIETIENNYQENEVLNEYNADNFEGVVQSVRDITINDEIGEELVTTSATVVQQAKQVQLPSDDNQNHSTITACMKEEVDEVYGRSLYSLQFILSQLQLSSSTPAAAPSSSSSHNNNSPNSSAILLTSGIVILSSGLGSVYSDLFHNSSVDFTTHLHLQQDVLTPAYVTAYSSLNAPSLKATEAEENHHRSTPSSNMLATATSELRLPYSSNTGVLDHDDDDSEQLFCAEISLGSVSNVVLRRSSDCDFFFRDGLKSNVLFSAFENNHSIPANTTTTTSTTTSTDSSSSCCKIELLIDGKLHLKLYDSYDRMQASGYSPLYECLFESPTSSISINDTDS